MSLLERESKVFQDFAETTSCHGVREIVRSKHIFWKIFWSLSVICHSVLLMTGCYYVLNDYINAPTVTRVAVNPVQNLTLPNVAFCNTNGLNETALSDDNVDDYIRRAFRNLGSLQFDPHVASWLSNRSLDIDKFLIRYSYTCDELLYKSCSFGISAKLRVPCCLAAKRVVHRHFGVCFIFEGGEQIEPGVQNGWRLDFTLPESKPPTDHEHQLAKQFAFTAFTFADGLAIEVGRRYQQFTKNPLLMGRNRVISIGFSPEQHLRQIENGHCLKGDNETITSGNSCFLWCEAKALSDICGCGYFGFSETFFPQVRLCEFRDSTCLSKNQSLIAAAKRVCRSECKPLCEEWNYRPSVTYSDLTLKPFGINLRLQMGYPTLEYTTLRFCVRSWNMSSFRPVDLVLREFAETTTCHGVREIIRSKRFFWKIFWTTSVVAHAALLMIGCTKVASDYLHAPTVTKVAVIHNSSLTLPHLAFCTPNSLDEAKLADIDDEEVVEQALSGIRDLQFKKEFNRFLIKRNFTMNTFLEKYSYTCSSLLTSCSFGDTVKADCCADAEKLHHRHFGVCFVLKGGEQVTPGVNEGWRLRFAYPDPPDDFQYFKTSSGNDALALTNGLAIELDRVYQHFTLNSLLVSRHQLAAISLRSELHRRVNGLKGSRCSSSPSFSSGNTCFYWCRAKIFAEHCGCGLYGMSEIYDPLLRLCSPDDYLCISDLAAEEYLNNETRKCQQNCKPVCEEWIYKPSVTYVNLPRSVEEPDGTNIRLVVGYSSMEYTEVQEVQSFTVFMAISSLGGQAGLWMGCSILTLIHAVTYCCWALMVGFTKRIKTVAGSRDSSTKEEIRPKGYGVTSGFNAQHGHEIRV